ncbi:MAG: hypothetical protein K2I30_04610 [Clostridia bacterium]|nr:hypothetical protein [Clostridia bacterium]
MKNFKRIFTVIFSCVLIVCTLALVAACKAEEKEEGYYVADRFVGKNNKVIGNWWCRVPDRINSGVLDTTQKPEGYKALYMDEFYITVYYTAPDASGAHAAGYSMAINHYWWNLESKKQVVADEITTLLEVKPKNLKLADNQYYYGGRFYTFYEGDGYIFTLDGYKMSAVSVVDDSKVLNFDFASAATMSLEYCKERHLQRGLHDSIINS